MEDNKKTTQSVETPVTDNKEVKGGKTFTQEDVDNIVAKRLKEEQAKNSESTSQAIKEALAEYERKAKLTEEEREKEAKSRREAELKDREDKVTLRERRIQAKEELESRGIPTDLVDFVVDLNEDITKEKIETLAKTYNKSVETGVTDKLKGTPPTDFSNTNNTDKPKYSGTTAF